LSLFREQNKRNNLIHSCLDNVYNTISDKHAGVTRYMSSRAMAHSTVARTLCTQRG